MGVTGFFARRCFLEPWRRGHFNLPVFQEHREQSLTLQQPTGLSTKSSVQPLSPLNTAQNRLPQGPYHSSLWVQSAVQGTKSWITRALTSPTNPQSTSPVHNDPMQPFIHSEGDLWAPSPSACRHLPRLNTPRPPKKSFPPLVSQQFIPP